MHGEDVSHCLRLAQYVLQLVPVPRALALSLDPPKHRDLDGSPQASGPSEAGWRFTK
jgi:hypothetical protein